jgi:hypothetical protein
LTDGNKAVIMVAPGVQVGQVLLVDKLFIMQVVAEHQLTAPLYMVGE